MWCAIAPSFQLDWSNAFRGWSLGRSCDSVLFMPDLILEQNIAIEQGSQLILGILPARE